MLPPALFGPQSEPAQPSTSDEQPEVSHVPCYEPTISDVFEVKDELVTKCRMPIELVDAIIDLAEYWPHTSGKRTGPFPVIRQGNNENDFLIRSYPLGYMTNPSDPTTFDVNYMENYLTIEPQPWYKGPDTPNSLTEKVTKQWTEESQLRGRPPCRKIVFTLKSHDQGWGGGVGNRGTYKGSYTWFDVGLERMVALDDPLPARRKAIPEDEKQFKAHFANERAEAAGYPHFSAGNTGKDDTPVWCTTKTIIPETATDTIPGGEIVQAFQHQLMPGINCLQKNKTAKVDAEEYKITWYCSDEIDPDSPEADGLEAKGRGRGTRNGNFVRKLRVGDCITIWGKARFPGWVNVVEEVGIDAYWAV